jgi:FkbM family methyltransferase
VIYHDQLKLHQIALGDVDDTITLYMDGRENFGWNTVLQQNDPSMIPVQVDMMTLDTWAAKEGIKNIYFMKIDVEGSEYM